MPVRWWLGDPGPLFRLETRGFDWSLPSLQVGRLRRREIGGVGVIGS